MKFRKLGTICALLAGPPWLIGCQTARDSQILNSRNRFSERKNVDAFRITSSAASPSRLSALQI